MQELTQFALVLTRRFSFIFPLTSCYRLTEEFCVIGFIFLEFLFIVDFMRSLGLFWQVKVWLGDNADHYYVLSRFLLSRMLTVTKVQNLAAAAAATTTIVLAALLWK